MLFFIIYIYTYIYELFQTCLKVLNISGNKITSLKNIKELYKLEILDATNNIIDDINDLTETINILISLKDLSLQGNPVTKYYRYKENLIANNDSISKFIYVYICYLCCFIMFIYLLFMFKFIYYAFFSTFIFYILNDINL